MLYLLTPYPEGAVRTKQKMSMIHAATGNHVEVNDPVLLAVIGRGASVSVISMSLDVLRIGDIEGFCNNLLTLSKKKKNRRKKKKKKKKEEEEEEEKEKREYE